MIDYPLRVIVFFSVLLVLLSWQTLFPRRPQRLWKSRWLHNFSFLLINSLVLRIFQPLLLGFIAYLNPFAGVLGQLELTQAWLLFSSILLLDCAVYWQHRFTHNIHWLWRLHQVHHSDVELDVSSAVRFHPLEIVISLVYKTAIIVIFGIPVAAVILFDILLNAAAMFNHTNIRLPSCIEYWLRKLIVTPDMHRIHHSRELAEANSNYGFCLSIWDKLFYSDTAQAKSGDAGLKIGLPKRKKRPQDSIKSLLLMPFSKLDE